MMAFPPEFVRGANGLRGARRAEKTLSQTMHSARGSRLTGRAGRQSLSQKSPGGLMKFTTRLVLGAFAVAALALTNLAVP
jgi:hypothetical protein